RLERLKLRFSRVLRRCPGRLRRTAALAAEAGALDEAERLLDGGLEHNRRIKAEGTRNHAQLLAERAALHIYRGAVASARPLLEQALAVERQLAQKQPAPRKDGELSAG